MVIRYHGLAGTMTYRSFHAAARSTFSEGERPLCRVRYIEPPEAVFPGSVTGRKCVSSPVADDAERPPVNGRKAEAPLPAVDARHCEACDADFPPARSWSRFAAPPAGCARIADFAHDFLLGGAQLLHGGPVHRRGRKRNRAAKA
jgi:hypothetical protein